MTESAATVIYLPCDVVPVRARIALGEGLSPIEKIVLRAIDARPCTGGELSELLGLGDRVTVDVLHGLWRYGHLRIDFGTRKLAVSEDIRRQIAERRLDTVAGIDSEEIQRDLMIEKLTGHVLPCEGHPKAPPLSKLAVDHPRADITLEGASRTAIAAAVNRSLDAAERRRETYARDGEGYTTTPVTARTGTGRPRRVRSILTNPRELRVASGRRWLAVEVLPSVNQNTGRLVVTVTDRRFPAERRDLASQLLTQLAADYPRDGFAAELRKAAAPRLHEPPPLRETIERLARDAARTAGIPAGQRRARHLELCDAARQVQGMLGSWIGAEVSAEIVSGDDHLHRIDELIDQAERQLVLVCPRVGDAAMSRIEQRLRKKIRAGVRVVLLWGRNYADEITGRAANIVNDLCRERGGGTVLRPLISARTEARLVIADDRAALVTSHNVLATGAGTQAIGVLVTGAAGTHSQAVRDLLERVRMIVPDGKMSRQLAVRAEDFAGGRDAGPPAAPMPAGRPLASDGPLPEAPPDDAGDDPRIAGAVAAWTAAWTGYARDVARALDSRTAVVATPVADGDHHEFLWRALRVARRRLVITSGRLGPEVCDENFRQAVGDCVRRGVTVTIRYEQALREEEGAAAALTRLAEAHPGQLSVRRGRTDAKILIWDDEAIVGGYEFLALAGHTMSTSYTQRRAQLSFRVTGADFAARLAALAGEPTGQVRAAEALAQPTAVLTPRSAPEAATAAQRIRNGALTGKPIIEALREEIDGSADPWAVLEALSAATRRPDDAGAAEATADGSVIDDIVMAAAAHCLERHASQAPRPVLDSWRRHLILACWECGRFVEAAVLRSDYADEAFRPRRWLAVLAALRGGEHREDALIAAEDIDLADGERPALLAVAVTELLTGSEYALYLLSELAAGGGDVWADLALAAVDYSRIAHGLLPRDVLRTAAAPGLREMRRARAWAALDQALARGGRVPVDNSPGRKTHFALFGQHGVFGQIAESAPRRNLGALAAAVHATGAGTPEPDTTAIAAGIVDQTWNQVAPGTSLLQGGRRGRYLARLSGILSAATAVLAASDDAGAADQRDARRTDEAAGELAHQLAALCADAGKQAAELAAPEGRLTRAALAELTALVVPEEAGGGTADRGDG
jgi:phosphatidylserine/phosphatidylglycerophosphate/cardiolipin synthase-like enzyme